MIQNIETQTVIAEGKIYGQPGDIRIRLYKPNEDVKKLVGKSVYIVPVVVGKVYGSTDGDIRIRIYSDYEDVVKNMIGQRVALIIITSP